MISNASEKLVAVRIEKRALRGVEGDFEVATNSAGDGAEIKLQLTSVEGAIQDELALSVPCSPPPKVEFFRCLQSGFRSCRRQ